MKRTEPQSIASIIDNAFSEAGLSDAMAEHKALFVWPDVVGQGINRYTTRRWIQRGVMHVCLTSAPLRNELSFHRTRLVELINKAVGTDVISSIEFH